MDHQNQASDDPERPGTTPGPPPDATHETAPGAPDAAPDATHDAATGAPDAAPNAHDAGSDFGAPTPRLPDLRPALIGWLAFIAVAGIAGIAIGAQELALMVALAGLFVAAQAADLDSRWTLFYWLLGAAVPVGGALAFSALTTLANQSALSGAPRVIAIGVSIFAALVSLLTAVRPFADELVSLLFRSDAPTHTLRLAARLVLLTFLFSIPGYFLVPDLMQNMLDDAKGFFARVSLGSELIGYVALALGSVGFLVRRGLRDALARLGVTRLPRSQWWIVVAGVVAIIAFNNLADWAQHRWLPAAWAHDSDMNKKLSRGLGPMRVILLGLAAGIGEEITLRGALQPRLGIVLTALLFASLHVQYSWSGMIVVGVIGLVLGVIRRRANTTASIAVHTLYDIAAVFGT
ncbi:MAG TPA: CPBP family glutamic-type intramembrane protease [Candidatus Saccharimonadaceae bacterium]|jgi:hypothetical protein|nr:CPBP family glutamic-type intramembrane protease [Candidatus Saccharimonadaceae bacterium]